MKTTANLILIFSLFLLSCQRDRSSEFNGNSEFRLLKYNDDTATAFLGVGLWSWPLPMDFDDDGDLDLLVSCPDVPSNGLYFFENPDGSSMPVFKPGVKLTSGDKNVQISYIEDHIMVTKGSVVYDGFKKYFFANARNIFDAQDLEKKHQKIRFKQWKYVDYDGDGDLDLIAGMDDWGDYGWDNAYDEKGLWTNGPQHGYVYLIRNQNDSLVFEDHIQAGGKPLDVYGAPSPNFGDFDGDGDLDIICGEFMDKFSWFENIGSRSSPIYSPGKFLRNETGIIKMDLQMIIPVAIDWDRDGDLDLIVGDEDGRVAWVEHTGKTLDGMPQYKNPVYFRQQADNVKFGALVTPFSSDWDDDGDEDLLCGNTAGYIGFVENLTGGIQPTWAEPVYLESEGKKIRILAGPNGSIQGPCEAKWGYTTLSVADWDGDGLKDIITNSIWGKIIWYRNTGRKGAPMLANAQPVEVNWADSIPKPVWNWWYPDETELATQWRTTPYAIDWNKDGLTDLVMLDHEGYLSFFERFKSGNKQMLRPGRRIFYSENYSGFDSKHRVKDSIPGLLRLNVNSNGRSGRCKFCFADWDMDGDLDLLVNSVNVSWLENAGTRNGMVHFIDRGPLTDDILAGHSTSPTTVDWDDDGDPDLIAGAEDGMLYYLENSK